MVRFHCVLSVLSLFSLWVPVCWQRGSLGGELGVQIESDVKDFSAVRTSIAYVGNLGKSITYVNN